MKVLLSIIIISARLINMMVAAFTIYIGHDGHIHLGSLYVQADTHPSDIHTHELENTDPSSTQYNTYCLHNSIHNDSGFEEKYHGLCTPFLLCCDMDVCPYGHYLLPSSSQESISPHSYTCELSGIQHIFLIYIHPNLVSKTFVTIARPPPKINILSHLKTIVLRS